MSKHTEGPWTVEESLIATVKTGDKGIEICEMSELGGIYGQDELEANAKLIRAAPEMLKMLKGVTALARLKYGNLDKEAYKYLSNVEALITEIESE